MHSFSGSDSGRSFVRSNRSLLLLLLFTALMCIGIPDAFAHAVAEGDKGYIQHLLFLLGVIFFLYRMKHIAIYVSLFAVGHSLTMLLGVYFNIGINSYIIDAIIGLSVVYKALDNLGAYQRWFGFQPNTKAATLIFGLFHGFGLSSKIIEYDISPDGLVPNLLAFNVGVEMGQLIALAMILIVMSFWRKTDGFFRHAYTANVAMMGAGFLLIGYQLTGYFIA